MDIPLIVKALRGNISNSKANTKVATAALIFAVDCLANFDHPLPSLPSSEIDKSDSGGNSDLVTAVRDYIKACLDAVESGVDVSTVTNTGGCVNLNAIKSLPSDGNKTANNNIISGIKIEETKANTVAAAMASVTAAAEIVSDIFKAKYASTFSQRGTFGDNLVSGEICLNNSVNLSSLSPSELASYLSRLPSVKLSRSFVLMCIVNVTLCSKQSQQSASASSNYVKKALFSRVLPLIMLFNDQEVKLLRQTGSIVLSNKTDVFADANRSVNRRGREGLSRVGFTLANPFGTNIIGEGDKPSDKKTLGDDNKKILKEERERRGVKRNISDNKNFRFRCCNFRYYVTAYHHLRFVKGFKSLLTNKGVDNDKEKKAELLYRNRNKIGKFAKYFGLENPFSSSSSSVLINQTPVISLSPASVTSTINNKGSEKKTDVKDDSKTLSYTDFISLSDLTTVMNLLIVKGDWCGGGGRGCNLIFTNLTRKLLLLISLAVGEQILEFEEEEDNNKEKTSSSDGEEKLIAKRNAIVIFKNTFIILMLKLALSSLNSPSNINNNHDRHNKYLNKDKSQFYFFSKLLSTFFLDSGNSLIGNCASYLLDGDKSIVNNDNSNDKLSKFSSLFVFDRSVVLDDHNFIIKLLLEFASSEGLLKLLPSSSISGNNSGVNNNSFGVSPNVFDNVAYILISRTEGSISSNNNMEKVSSSISVFASFILLQIRHRLIASSRKVLLLGNNNINNNNNNNNNINENEKEGFKGDLAANVNDKLSIPPGGDDYVRKGCNSAVTNGGVNDTKDDGGNNSNGSLVGYNSPIDDPDGLLEIERRERWEERQRRREVRREESRLVENLLVKNQRKTRSFKVNHNVLIDCMRSKPGLLYALLNLSSSHFTLGLINSKNDKKEVKRSYNNVICPGILKLEDKKYEVGDEENNSSSYDDLLVFCMYMLGQTTCTAPLTADIIFVLKAIDREQLKRYFETNSNDFSAQLCAAFSNNPAIYKECGVVDNAEATLGGSSKSGTSSSISAASSSCLFGKGYRGRRSFLNLNNRGRCTAEVAADAIAQAFVPSPTSFALKEPRVLTDPRGDQADSKKHGDLSVDESVNDVIFCSDSLWGVLCDNVTYTLQNRCRSGEERTSVMALFVSLLRETVKTVKTAEILSKEDVLSDPLYLLSAGNKSNVGDEGTGEKLDKLSLSFLLSKYPLPESSRVFKLIKNHIESGVELMMELCWEAVSLIPECVNYLECSTTTPSSSSSGSKIVLKAIGKLNSASQRACLAYAPEQFTQANELCWSKLQQEAAENEVVRPNALLSLYFTHPSLSSAVDRVASAVGNLKTLSQFNNSLSLLFSTLLLAPSSPSRNSSIQFSSPAPPFLTLLTSFSGSKEGIRVVEAGIRVAESTENYDLITTTLAGSSALARLVSEYIKHRVKRAREEIRHKNLEPSACVGGSGITQFLLKLWHSLAFKVFHLQIGNFDLQTDKDELAVINDGKGRKEKRAAAAGIGSSNQRQAQHQGTVPGLSEEQDKLTPPCAGFAISTVAPLVLAHLCELQQLEERRNKGQKTGLKRETFSGTGSTVNSSSSSSSSSSKSMEDKGYASALSGEDGARDKQTLPYPSTLSKLIPRVLCEILMCCGHDYVTGHDPLYFTPIEGGELEEMAFGKSVEISDANHNLNPSGGVNNNSGSSSSSTVTLVPTTSAVAGRYRTSSITCNTRIFKGIFRDYSMLLDQYCIEVAELLSHHLTTVGSFTTAGLQGKNKTGDYRATPSVDEHLSESELITAIIGNNTSNKWSERGGEEEDGGRFTRIATAAGRALGILLTRFSVNRSADEAKLAKAAANATFNAILKQLESSAKFFREQSELDKVISSRDLSVLNSFVYKGLKERGLVKDYPQLGKLPKGVTMEDLEIQKEKDRRAVKEARVKILIDVLKRKYVIFDDILNHLSPFLALRTIGFFAPCSIESVGVVYPFIHKLLSDFENTPGIVSNVACDACNGLFFHTPFRSISSHIVKVSARLSNPSLVTMTGTVVAEIVVIALLMRQMASHLIPSGFLCVLLPFIKGAFMCGKGKSTTLLIPTPTQYQLLSVLSSFVSRGDIPMKGESVSLYLNIIGTYPTLYKTVMNGLNSLVPHVPATGILSLIRGCFLGNELQKECSISALTKFTDFEGYRTALVVVFAMSHDTKQSVVETANKILEKRQFSPTESDLTVLISLLKEYGPQNAASCLRISNSIKEVLRRFPGAEQGLITDILTKLDEKSGVTVLQTITPLLGCDSVVQAMTYLCDIIENTKSAVALLKEVLDVGKAILGYAAASGGRNDENGPSAVTEKVANRIQKRLKTTLPKSFPADHRELHGAISVVWLTMVAVQTGDLEYLCSTLDQQGTILSTSTTPMVHRFVQECVCEIARNRKMQNHEKLFEFTQKCMSQCFNAQMHARKRAFAAGFVGVVQGLGLSSLRKFGVMPAFTIAQKERQVQRVGAMVLIEALADGLGRLFDPYALSLVPLLLECVSEKDCKISEAADDASKAVMRNMSSAGLSQLIPMLINGLESSSTKKRASSLGFVGFVAFCSPRILAHALPVIMTHVTSCLFDANSSVSNAAFTALKRVAGVVSNKEIQEHIDNILSAIRNPASETEFALDALLYTRFLTAIDPASLAILIPVVTRGLVSPSYVVKGKAAQIVAAMVNLVTETRTLAPYIDELLRRLQNAAVEPQPEVRATSAKAIAALAAVNKGPFLDKAYEWCFVTISNAKTTAEMAGGALVLVELVLSCGKHLLFGSIQAIESGVRDPNPDVREGFQHVMVYAPSVLPEEVFQEFLPLAFPWVLTGLSDHFERVRNTALVAGNNIMSLYGSRNLSLVLDPILDGVLSEDTNQRQSSLLLLAKLAIYVITTLKKSAKADSQAADSQAAAAPAVGAENADTGEGHNNGAEAAVEGGENGDGLVEKMAEIDPLSQGKGSDGVIILESAREAERRGLSIVTLLEEHLGAEKYVKVFSALHIGRSEDNSSVRTDVTNAWQIGVPNARRVIQKLFPGIVMMLIKFASSSNPECVDLAAKTIEYTCTRLSETVENFVLAFVEQFKKGTKRHVIGVLACLREAIAHTESETIRELGGHLLAVTLPSLQSEDEEIRSCAGVLFRDVSKKVGPLLIESTIKDNINSSVVSITEIIRVRPQSALSVVFKLLDELKEFLPVHMELIREILTIEQAGDHMTKFLDLTTMTILRAMQQPGGCEGAEEAMGEFSASLPSCYAAVPISHFVLATKKPETSLSAIIAAKAYASNVLIEWDKEKGSVTGPTPLSEVIKLLIAALDSEDRKICVAAAEAIVDLFTTTERRIIEEFLEEEEKEDSAGVRRFVNRYFISLIDVVHQSLDGRSFFTSGGQHIRHGGEREETPDKRERDDFKNPVGDSQSEERFSVLLAYPKLFDTFLMLYLRALDFGDTQQKVRAISAIIDLLEHSPGALVAASMRTIGGKASKSLFVKQEGDAIAGILRLCLYIISSPTGEKEKMLENAFSIAMVGGVLSESQEARTLALRIVIKILRRNPSQLATVLGSVLTKKATICAEEGEDVSVSGFSKKASICRFISAVIRHGLTAGPSSAEQKNPANFSPVMASNITALMTMVKSWWMTPSSMALGAAAGGAVASLCLYPLIPDEEVEAIAQNAISMLNPLVNRSITLNGVGAMSCLFTILQNDKIFSRVSGVQFVDIVAEQVKKSTKVFSTDPFARVWILRTAAVINLRAAVTHGTGDKRVILAPEDIAPMLVNLQPSDELSQGAAFFVKETFPEAIDAAIELSIAKASKEQEGGDKANSAFGVRTICPTPSFMHETVGFYDCDLEDECYLVINDSKK